MEAWRHREKTGCRECCRLTAKPVELRMVTVREQSGKSTLLPLSWWVTLFKGKCHLKVCPQYTGMGKSKASFKITERGTHENSWHIKMFDHHTSTVGRLKQGSMGFIDRPRIYKQTTGLSARRMRNKLKACQRQGKGLLYRQLCYRGMPGSSEFQLVLKMIENTSQRSVRIYIEQLLRFWCGECWDIWND